MFSYCHQTTGAAQVSFGGLSVLIAIAEELQMFIAEAPLGARFWEENEQCSQHGDITTSKAALWLQAPALALV